MGVYVVCLEATQASRGYETGTFSNERALADTRGLKRPPSTLCQFSSQRRSTKSLQKGRERCLNGREIDPLPTESVSRWLSRDRNGLARAAVKMIGELREWGPHEHVELVGLVVCESV